MASINDGVRLSGLAKLVADAVSSDKDNLASIIVSKAKGAKGDKGDQGVKGDKGDKGDPGNVGLTGPPGPLEHVLLIAVPSSATTWPEWPLTRPSGSIVEWDRRWDENTNAPIPSVAQGYRQGDRIVPMLVGETPPVVQDPMTTTLPLFYSESGATASTSDIRNTAVDNTAGGKSNTWVGGYNSGTGTATMRLQRENSQGGVINLYGEAAIYLDTQKTITPGDVDVEFNWLTASSDTSKLTINFAGAPADTTGLVQVTMSRDKTAGTATFAYRDDPNGVTSTVTIGSAKTWVNDGLVKIKIRSGKLNVSYNGSDVGTVDKFTVPTAVRFHPASYSGAKIDNLKVYNSAGA